MNGNPDCNALRIKISFKNELTDCHVILLKNEWRRFVEILNNHKFLEFADGELLPIKNIDSVKVVAQGFTLDKRSGLYPVS